MFHWVIFYPPDFGVVYIMDMPLLSELPQQEALISPTSDLNKSI